MIGAGKSYGLDFAHAYAVQRNTPCLPTRNFFAGTPCFLAKNPVEQSLSFPSARTVVIVKV